MDKIKKHSAGGIVLDPKTEKILFTKKMAKQKRVARVRKLLYTIFEIKPEEAIKKFKLWTFTKGKIEKGMTTREAAIQEIEEEWGIKTKDIIEKKYLGSFLKKKDYGFKEVDMFLYILTKDYPNLKPTDKRHIAAFVELEKAEKYMQNQEEKKFFLKIKDEITQALLAYKEHNNALLEEKNIDVTEVDLGVER